MDGTNFEEHIFSVYIIQEKKKLDTKLIIKNIPI